MPDYIAAVWDSRQPSCDSAVAAIRRRIRETLPNWSLLVDERGLLVACPAADIHSHEFIRLDDGGLIIGTVFWRAAHGNGRVSQVPRLIKQRLQRTRGRACVDELWGSYVLLLRDPAAHASCIFNGPMSRVSCFHAAFGKLTLCFSSVEDYATLGLVPLSINWSTIKAQVTGGDYLTHATALNGISELTSGECLLFRDDGISREVYWSPRTLPTVDVRTADDAADLLGASTHACIDAWASLHSKLLLTLSGGLDSSIVLSSLRKASTQPQIVGFNFFWRGSADERPFARSMAAHAGIELIEHELNRSTNLAVLHTVARTARPVLDFTGFELEPIMLDLAQQQGASAIVTGEMGDDVFGHAIGPEALADCLFRVGPGLAFLAATYDYAMLRRLSIWRALLQGTRAYAWMSRVRHWSTYRYSRRLGRTRERGLAADSVFDEYEAELDEHVHPWLREMRDVPPGRLSLITALMLATSTWSHSPFGRRGVSFLMPLSSQPLIEATASIPARLHFEQGENGAIAKRAFGKNLSPLVISRGTGKGGPELWLKDTFEQNRAFLREFLLEGELVGRGILDPAKVRSAISGELSRSRVPVAEIMVQLYIEAWVRKWKETERLAVPQRYLEAASA